MPDTDLNTVFLIYCTDKSTALSVADELLTNKIRCIDILEYSAEMHYADYLNDLAPEERLPLLFVFSKSERVLVQSYEDLLKMQARLNVEAA